MVSYWDNFKNWVNNLNPAPSKPSNYPLSGYVNPQTKQSIQVKNPPLTPPTATTKPVSVQGNQQKDLLTPTVTAIKRAYDLGLSIVNPLGYKNNLEIELDTAKQLNHEADLLYRKAQKETDIQKKKDLLLKATNYNLQASEISKNVQRETPNLLNLPQLTTAGFAKTLNIPQFEGVIQQTTRNLVEDYRKKYPQYNVPTDIPIDEQARQYSQLIRKEAEQKFGEPKLPEGYKEPETFIGRFLESSKDMWYSKMKTGIYGTMQYFARSFNLPELSTKVEKMTEEAYAYARSREDLRAPEEFSDLPHIVESIKKDPLKTIPLATAQFFAGALPYTLATILAEMAIPGGGVAFIYSLEKGNFQRELLEKGVDYEHADVASNIFGLASATIENMSGYTPKSVANWLSKEPIQNLLKQSWKNVLAQIPKAMVKTLFNSIEEGNEEVYQDLAGQLIKWWLDIPDNKENIVPQLAYEWVGGFIGSAPLGVTNFNYHPEISGLSVRSIEPENLVPEGEAYSGKTSGEGYTFVGLTKNSKGRYEINYRVPFQNGIEKLYVTYKDIPSALKAVKEIFVYEKDQPVSEEAQKRLQVTDVQSDPKIYVLTQTLSSLEEELSHMDIRMTEGLNVDMEKYDRIERQISDIQRQIAERKRELLAKNKEIVPQATETPVEEKAEIPAEEKVETSLQEAKPEAKPEVKPIDINDINKNTNFNELTDSQKLGLIDKVIWRFIYRPTDKNRYGTIVGSPEDNNYKISEQLLDNIVGYYENLHNASNPILPKEHLEEIEKGLDLIKKIINEIQDENTKSQLTTLYNKIVKTPKLKPEVKPEVKPVPKIAPEAPKSPTRGGLPERGIKQPPKPKEGAKPKKSLPKEEKLEVVSNVTIGDKLDVDIEQDIKDQPVTVVKEGGEEETLEIPTEPVEIYDREWRKVKTTDPIAIMKWNEVKQNLDDLLTIFKQAIPDLKELKATQKELVSSLRDIQLAKLDAIFAEAKDINEFKQRLGELSNVAEKSVSEKVQKLFDGETLNKAFSVIQYFSGNDWLKLSALKAFLDLSTGHTAYASGYKAIAKIFGSEFSLQIKQLFPLSTSEKVLYFISAVYNVPRSWLAGFFDLSATQVQLLLASSGHPILALKALGAGIKAFAEGFMHPSEQTLAIQSIWQDPDMKRLVYEAKISFTNPFGVGGEKFQEPFIGLSILEKVPVVRNIVGGTAAAFDTQISLMQYYLGKTYLKVLEATGDVTKENLESMGRFINDITGRANIPRSMRKITTVLNYGFFSPRMLIATFDTLNPVLYVKLPKELRKYAARMWLAFLSLGFLKLFGARMFGAEDTTKDSTSADYLKIKIGNYRNNPFGKYQAIAVLLSRIIKGEYTSTTTGMKQVVGWATGYQGTSYAELITRFFASREHPTAAYLVDAIKGQTEEGLPFRWGSETLRLFIPMFFADTTELLYEARKNNWSPVLTLFATIDAFLGAPSQTYGGYIPAMFQDPNTGKYTLKLIQYPQTQEVIWNKVFKQPLTQFDPKDWEYVTNKYRADQAKSYLSKTFNSLMTQVENGKLTSDEAYKKWQEITKSLKIPISYTNTNPDNPYLQEYNRLLLQGNKVPTLDFKFYQGLDAEDIIGYNKTLDNLRNKALQAIINAPRYQQLPDDYKSKALTQAINEVEQQYNLNCLKNILSKVPKEQIPDVLIELKKSGLMTESIFNQLKQGF